MSTQHYMTLKRNLIYASINRGKRLIALEGQKRALAMAVKGKARQTPVVKADREAVASNCAAVKRPVMRTRTRL